MIKKIGEIVADLPEAAIFYFPLWGPAALAVLATAGKIERVPTDQKETLRTQIINTGTSVNCLGKEVVRITADNGKTVELRVKKCN